jgi:hypothetical protein
VTQEGDARVHVLPAGDEFVIESTGVIVVQAFTPAPPEFGPRAEQESLEQFLFDRNSGAA